VGIFIGHPERGIVASIKPARNPGRGSVEQPSSDWKSVDCACRHCGRQADATHDA
jgi:hypothetical protein